MADDTAALVLSLEARFDKFEKAMKDMTSAVDKQTKIIEDRFAAMTKVIQSELGKISASMVSELGIAGRVLSALGPAGIIVATGLGAVVLALNATAAAAERVGEKAIAIKSFAQSTGFSLTEAQGVRKAFNELGVDSEKAETVIERFTLALDQLRKTGSGPLVEGLERVDTELISLLLHTRDAPEAFRLVVLAMQKMATESRNTLARGLGGRGGIDIFAELASNADKFFRAWDAGMAKAKPDEAIKKIAEQQKILNALNKEAEREWDKMFPTDEFMRAKIRALEEYVGWLRLANDPSLLREKITTQSGFARTLKAITEGSMAPLRPGASQVMDDVFDTTNRFNEAFKQTNKGLAEGINKIAEAKREELKATEDAARAGIQSAGTESEARKNTLIDINNQIIALERLKKVSGQAFSPQDEERLQRLLAQRTQLGIQGGPDLTGARLANEKAISDQFTQQQIAMRERLGIVTEEELVASRRLDIEKQIREGVIRTNAERVQALDLAKKESFDRAQALQVRLSATPGFTKLIQDSTNFAKVTDTLAVSAVNHLTDAIFEAVSGAKSFEEAFKAMAQVVLQEIAKMAIKFALLQSFKIATGGVTLPGLAEGGPVLAGSPVVVGESGPEVFMPSSGGFIMPNKALGGMGGGQNVNMGGFNIDARGAQLGVADEIMRKLRAEMPAIAVSSVSQAQRFGILRSQR